MKPAHHLTYRCNGLDERALCIGDPGNERVILIVPPLFDEMNRMRAVLVGAMRTLAVRGVAALLPDLPGCNESMAPIESQTLESWQAAMAQAAEQLHATHVATVRGGALVAVGVALPQWRLAPAKGASILKTMLRTRIASDREAGRTSTLESLLHASATGSVDLAGYRLSAAMLSSLEVADAAETPNSTDVMLGEGLDLVSGKPLWLRAEPLEDAEMSAAVAQRLDHWSASCGG